LTPHNRLFRRRQLWCY